MWENTLKMSDNIMIIYPKTLATIWFVIMDISSWFCLHLFPFHEMSIPHKDNQCIDSKLLLTYDNWRPIPFRIQLIFFTV